MTKKRALTPGGYRPLSQVHEIAPGHVLDTSDGRLRELDEAGNVVADFGPAPAAEHRIRAIRPEPPGKASPKRDR